MSEEPGKHKAGPEQAVAKHTPGPWNVDSNDPFVVYPYNGYAVARCKPGGRKCKDAVAVATARANARLIAAAPDLLENLTRVLVWMDGISDRLPADMRPAIDAAHAAIAKATGEEGAE